LTKSGEGDDREETIEGKDIVVGNKNEEGVVTLDLSG